MVGARSRRCLRMAVFLPRCHSSEYPWRAGGGRASRAAAVGLSFFMLGAMEMEGVLLSHSSGLR